jgi:cell division protein YceG involved in septum cleavage
MTDDWLGGDPFADSKDPAATEREQRRRERQERRRKREEKRGVQEAVASPPLPPVPQGPEEGFGDEEQTGAPAEPLGPRGAHRRRRRLLLLGVIAVLLLAVVGAAVTYRDFNEEPPPPPVLRTITLTVPEGYSRAQTAALAREAGLHGDYARASKGHEGFLFPDTFELEKRAPVSDLVQLQLQDFKRRTAAIDMTFARSKNLTMQDVVTIASMVEEEAQLDSERRLVAAVIYNRLREGIPLGIDATVRFATGNYEQPLTESELATDSPFNTRLYAGLPPGPISSPGLASIEAAAHPAQVDYLYYVVKPGTCGVHAFSSTDVEFQADVARYNEAREAAGGESPDSCG